MAAERGLEFEAKSFISQKRSQKSIDGEIIAKDLQIVKLQSDIDDLRLELSLKDQEIKKLHDFQEKSSQSSTDEAVRGYLKAPYQEELQYWRDLALKSSQRGSFNPQRVDEAFSMRLSVLEEEYLMKEKELNRKDDLISRREKEMVENKHLLQTREGQIRVKEAQLRASKEEIERVRIELEERERDHAERLSTFTFSATQRGYIDSDHRKDLEELEIQVAHLAQELEESRVQIIQCKKTENELLAKNQSLQNQVQMINFKLQENEEKEKLTNSQTNWMNQMTLNKEEMKTCLKNDQLDSFLNKINTVFEKAEEIFKNKELISPVISSLVSRISSSKSSPHVQLSLLPSLLSNLLSTLTSPPTQPPQLPPPTLSTPAPPAPTSSELADSQVQPVANLESRLLSALSSLDSRYLAATRQLGDQGRVLEALLAGWQEAAVSQAVADALQILQAGWKVADGDGDRELADKKAKAALICVERLASSVGNRRLAMAVKGAGGMQVGGAGGTARRNKEAREDSVGLDEDLLFLSRQALGRQRFSEDHN